MLFFKGMAFAPLFLAALVLVVNADSVVFKRCKEKSFMYTSERALDTRPDLKATRVVLLYCGLKKLETGDFEGLPNVISINMHKNKFKILDAKEFSAVPGLTELDISENGLESIPRFGYYNLFPNMTQLNLKDNKISALCHSDIFSSMEKLQLLELSNNRIGYIHPDMFKPLKSLEKIHLDNNVIPYISEKMLQIKTLKSIFLQDNMIEYVAPDAFLGSQVKMLWLQGNRLTYLPEHFLLEINKAGGNLRSVPLSQNPWQCRCLLELLAEAHHIGVREYFSFYYSGSSPTCVTDYKVECIRTKKEEVSVSLSLLKSYLVESKLQKYC